MKSIHREPGAYSHLERAAAMFNMMIERGDLPEGWRVDIPMDGRSVEPKLYGVHQADVGQSRLLEGYAIGLAMASGTITLGKCREWLSAAGASQSHELSMFGMNVRDLWSVDDE